MPLSRLALPLALMALLASGYARSQAVYRCVEKGKPVSLQTEPCPATAKITGIKEFRPDRELTWQEKQARDAQWARPSTSHSSAAYIRTAPAPAITNRCADAKAERDAWERSTGLNRSYESLRSWNDHVARACK